MMAIKNMHGMGGGGKLPTTRWNVVEAAGREPMAERNEALAELCATYWKPVYGFIRAMGRSHEEARDLTQGFFTTQLLEKNDVAALDQERGKFRSWLLKAVKNYLANDLAQARAKKRDPGTPLVSIDAPDAEGRCPVLPGHDNTPERIYERRWAMTILEQALHKLRDGYEKRGQGPLFEKLTPFLVGSGEGRYRPIAEELGISEEAFKVHVFRCRGRFHDRIRAEIADTVSSEDQVEDEMRHLLSGLQSR
jgi:RNA polymerase sigma-70 factor (ECF subfamily)